MDKPLDGINIVGSADGSTMLQGELNKSIKVGGGCGSVQKICFFIRTQSSSCHLRNQIHHIHAHHKEDVLE
jgi:hypothetical protein